MLEIEIKKTNPLSRFLVESRLALIIAYISEHYRKETLQTRAPEIRLGHLIAWIEEHYSEPVSNEDLEKRAHMSTSTLIRHFREATGLSPMQYLIQTRIRHACEKIAQNQMGNSITEIAFECGFEDSNYFTRQFTKIIGKSPRDYRKSILNFPI